MPNFSGKKVDTGVPVTIDKERYTEGDSSAALEGGVALGEKPSNVVYPLQIDADGYLKVTSIGGVAGTEYSDGVVNTNSKGSLIMGDDGTNIQNISVDANGRLRIEVVELPNKLVAWTQILVNVSTATTTELKAVVVGHTYTVIGISLTVAAENNLTWKSNTTALSGPMDFGGSGEPHGWQANMWPHGLKCATGEALKLTTTTTGRVAGFIMILDES